MTKRTKTLARIGLYIAERPSDEGRRNPQPVEAGLVIRNPDLSERYFPIEMNPEEFEGRFLRQRFDFRDPPKENFPLERIPEDFYEAIAHYQRVACIEESTFRGDWTLRTSDNSLIIYQSILPVNLFDLCRERNGKLLDNLPSSSASPNTATKR
jgi:hypothetical protein